MGEFELGVPKGKGYYKNREGQRIEGEFVWVVQRAESDGDYTGLTINHDKYGYLPPLLQLVLVYFF